MKIDVKRRQQISKRTTAYSLCAVVCVYCVGEKKTR